jgi:hypothetical protein
MKLSKDFFYFFAMTGNKTIDRDGSPYYWAALEGFNDLDVTATMDMFAQWKGLHKRRHLQAVMFFCYCCTVESKDVHHANEVKCMHFCADRTDVDSMHFHHDITTETVVANMKNDVTELQAKLSESLENIEKSTKVCVYHDNHHGRYSEKNSIDHKPLGMEYIEEYSEFICDEMEL